MTITDVLPTLLEAAGGGNAIPSDLDGHSQIQALLGGDSERADYVAAQITGGFAVYRWPWKMIDAPVPKLFNVSVDPLEETNLASLKPELVEALQVRLSNWNFSDDPGPPILEVLFDPDTFGGVEDRIPWPDKVH